MTWEEAREKIGDKNNIKVDTDLNTKRSRENDYRHVKLVPPPHFRVRIGKRSYINIPWDMLEKCWQELNKTREYNTEVFDKACPGIRKNKGCYVHTIGKIFENAGLVESDDNDKHYKSK